MRTYSVLSKHGSIGRSINNLGSVAEASTFFYTARPLFDDEHYLKILRRVLAIERLESETNKAKKKESKQ